MANELEELQREAAALDAQINDAPQDSIKRLQMEAKYKQLALKISEMKRAQQAR